MTRFRPCIDLHQGKVKQIIGGTLTDGAGDQPVENHVSDRSAEDFAKIYAADRLWGGHVIRLGSGNDEAARAALAAYPNGLQIGGGIVPENAASWLDAGASHVIVTSWLFEPNGKFSDEKLSKLVRHVGKNRLVIDLSCRRVDSGSGGWFVASDRWQTITDLSVEHATIQRLSDSCAEFLIHAADVEGLQAGIDTELVDYLSDVSPVPVTYAGGIRNMQDIKNIHRASHGTMDFTVGSALDLFGGTKIQYQELVKSYS